MKQMELLAHKTKASFGGSLLTGRRKERRPLNSKKAIHLVLKAKDSFLLLRNRDRVEEILRKYAAKMGIRIYDTGVHADHIHLALKAANRITYVRWIRAVTSVLVQKIPKLKWRLRPFTKIVSWGRSFRSLKNYIFWNRIEGDFIKKAHERVENFIETHIGPFFPRPNR